MALKNTWIPKKDTTDGSDGDYIVAKDINEIAHAVIELEENPDTYSKDDIDTLLSKKRDNDDFTPIASADKVQETISLVGITTVETSDDENGWEITSNTLSATVNPLFSNGAIFHIDFQGNVNLEIDANAFEGAGLHPAEAGYVEIDGIKLTAENVSTFGCKYRYNGDITREIIIQAKYARYEFATFIKNIKIYSDGFMSGEQAERLDNLDTKIGNIELALDELHNHAKKQQSFDGIIRLEYNDGIIDTYELDNTTTAGTYRVVIDSTNDIIGNTDKKQYILLVGISSYGEEILYTQTRISNNGMMETRSRSNFDEEWSEWHNKMLDELHGYAQADMGLM